MRSELSLFERVGATATPMHRVVTPRPADIAPRRAVRPSRPPARSLTIVDLARDDLSGGMRDYLAAKSRRAQRRGSFAHHVVTPARGLNRTLGRIGPDVVLLHEQRRQPRALLRLTDEIGATLVGVGHDGTDQSIPLRRGLHPAFHPGRHVARRRHVLYAGRLDPSKGVSTLLEAAALAGGAWSLRIVGEGPAHGALRRQAQRRALGRTVAFVPYVRDRERLARYYAEASCVVAPGEAESFGLVALEAAACGTPVVCCSSAPVAVLLGELAETFEPGDAAGMAAAIDRARARRPDLLAAARLVAEYSWDEVLDAELRDLQALIP